MYYSTTTVISPVSSFETNTTGSPLCDRPGYSQGTGYQRKIENSSQNGLYRSRMSQKLFVYSQQRDTDSDSFMDGHENVAHVRFIAHPLIFRVPLQASCCSSRSYSGVAAVLV